MGEPDPKLCDAPVQVGEGCAFRLRNFRCRWRDERSADSFPKGFSYGGWDCSFGRFGFVKFKNY